MKISLILQSLAHTSSHTVKQCWYSHQKKICLQCIYLKYKFQLNVFNEYIEMLKKMQVPSSSSYKLHSMSYYLACMMDILTYSSLKTKFPYQLFCFQIQFFHQYCFLMELKYLSSRLFSRKFLLHYQHC